LDLNINDPEFARRCAETLLEMLESRQPLAASV